MAPKNNQPIVPQYQCIVIHIKLTRLPYRLWTTKYLANCTTVSGCNPAPEIDQETVVQIIFNQLYHSPECHPASETGLESVSVIIQPTVPQS